MIIRLTLLERLLHRLHILPTPVMDAFGGVLFGRALVIAVRRGLFEAIAPGGTDAHALSAATGLHREAVSLVADACVAGGYLRRRGTLYQLAPEGRKWLLRESPDSLVSLLRYFETLHDRWAALEGSLVRGKPPQPYYATFTEAEWRLYALAMRDLARQILPYVARVIRVPRNRSLLVDIGGSHGLYALALCSRHPGLRAIVMDFSPVLRVAEEFIREAHLADRVATHARDFMRQSIPEGADVILMFNIIHGLSPEENVALVGRALEALTPGGRLYILDQLKGQADASGLGRFLPLMVGINLLNEIGGTAYGVNDVEEWCGGRGRVRRVRLRFPGVTLLEIVRRRPGEGRKKVTG
jgi:hypothetical protein